MAAYKALELIRRLRDAGCEVVPVLTAGAKQFITPLSVASLAQHKVYDDLWSLTDEAEMGHIRLARETDLVLVTPATAHFMAKMALGLADDLASTLCLATDKPIFIAPAMNPVMWAAPATQANVQTLQARGVQFIGPTGGDMACGENGEGRLAEIDAIVTAVLSSSTRSVRDLSNKMAPRADGAKMTTILQGKHVLVTTGPTQEAIDPVRYLTNHSSGKQGVAIAVALETAGAQVTLVHGPLQIAVPNGIKSIPVTTAKEMLAACETALPADIAICAAAVSDWQAEVAPQKLKKRNGENTLTMQLQQTPDILAALSQHPTLRPKIVIGFAAETDDLLANAQGKLMRKGCDALIANQAGAVFGSDDNEIWFLTPHAAPQHWPRQSKQAIAERLVAAIIQQLA